MASAHWLMVLLLGGAVSPPAQTDSILPPAVELARFRRTLTRPRPARLAGESSRAALVAAFAAAVERKDGAALGRLVIDRAEFAWLYYPESEYARPPYRQNPALVWFRMVAATEKGANRVLTRDGGARLGMVGHRCATPPLVQGRNRIWRSCVLLVGGPGATRERRLFGSILERNGRFKFLTLASEY